MQVTVSLKNPPSGGTMWSVRLTDWDITTLIDFVGHNGIDRLDIAETATFEIPAGLNFPLRIVDLSVKKWKDGIVGGTIQYLYAVQSYRPYLWDWDIGDYGTEPDPTYREVFIPEPGGYYYNVATERFELIEAAPSAPCEITITAPSSAAEGGTVNVSVVVKNVSAYNYSYKATISAVPDRYPDYAIGSIDQVITSGSSVTRNVSFTMPDCDVTVFIWVERWAADHWAYDNSASRVVSLEAPVPEVPCKITITAPNSAAEGEKVSVSALLENVSSYGAIYKTEIYAVPDLFPSFRIGTIEKYIDSGATFTAYGSFTMPASNTTILIRVERWAVDHWVYDNSASKVVEVVPEYRGTISKKELEYDETRSIIPVY